LNFHWDGLNASLAVKQDITLMKFGEIEITQSITPDEKTATFTLSDASLTQN
jgi:hypothetical protein